MEAPLVTVAITAVKPAGDKTFSREGLIAELILDTANAIINRRFEILSKDPAAPFIGGGAPSDRI